MANFVVFCGSSEGTGATHHLIVQKLPKMVQKGQSMGF